MMQKRAAEEFTQFPFAQFLDMKWVWSGRELGIGLSIWRRQNQHAVGTQNALNFQEKLLLFCNMLQRLERDDDVYRCSRQRNRTAISFREIDDFIAVACSRVANRIGVPVHTGNFSRNLSKQGTPVAFAARYIQHILLPAKLQ